MAALNEISLRNLAGQLGPEWEALATYLGFTVAQIDRFKIDYHGQENQIFRMLVKWKQQQGASPNQLEFLCEKLKLADRKDLADILSGLEVSLKDVAATKKALIDNTAKARQRVKDRAAEARANSNATVNAEEKRLLDEITSQEREQNKRLDEHEETLSTKLHSLSQYSAISKGMEGLRVQPTPMAAGLKSHPVFVKNKKLFDLGKVMVEDTWEMCHSFGARGSGEGEFEGARGIAAAAEPDEIAVTDLENKRVVICNHQGQTRSTIPIVASDVVAVSNQWVCANPYKVMVYHRDSTHKCDFHVVPEDQVGNADSSLFSVAIMPNGNIIAGLEKKVLVELDPRNGEILHTMPVKITPNYLAVLSNGWIAISDVEQGLVEKVEVSNGKAVTVSTIQPTIDGKPVKYCRGVCSNSSGIYLAMDTGYLDTGHIHHYNCVGQFVSCVAQGLYNPLGITFTADGQQLAVADRYSVKVYHKV